MTVLEPDSTVPPAIINAVVDALDPFALADLDMPVIPETVWPVIQSSTD